MEAGGLGVVAGGFGQLRSAGRERVLVKRGEGLDALGEAGGEGGVAERKRSADETRQVPGVDLVGARPGDRVELGKQSARPLALALGEQQRGAGRDGHRDPLRLAAVAGGAQQRLRVGRLLVVASFSEQPQLQRPRLDEVDVSGLLEPIGDRGGVGERLLDLPDTRAQRRFPTGHDVRRLGDAAPARELDPLPEDIETGLWPVVRPGDEREVVVQDGGGPSLPVLESERERAPHLLHPLPLPQGGAGGAAVTERARGHGLPELGGERERPVAGGDRLRVGGADVP